MADLEYRIGGLRIDVKRLDFDDDDPYDAVHLFVVQAIDDVISIYVAPAGFHVIVSRAFKLEEDIVGGGSCYRDTEGRFFVGDYSGEYGAIPEYVAEIFAEMIRAELEKQGISFVGVMGHTEKNTNEYWKKR